jgi:glycosyltransferase involved in cell wall biosynthesis
MMSMGDLKVALIHDEFVRRGGAEIVFEELLRIFPKADVYALYTSNRPSIVVDGRKYSIRTSFLQQLPLWFRRHPSRLLPLLPHAAEFFDLSEYDLVISSSSGFAKGVITRSSIPHISYCHTPTRYLWDSTQEAGNRAPWGGKFLSRTLLHYLRMADFAAAQRPDIIISNSVYTQRRVEQYYRRPSEVIYPPIRTDFFTPLALGDRKSFVILGRLTSSKHFEQAIQVCNKLQLPLTVIGVGSEMNRLRSMAGSKTRLIGKVSDEQVRQHLRSARALLQPGVEDFGMAAAEALACGTPVVGYADGGIKEIVTSGKHGILYKTPRAEGLAEALRQFMIQEREFQVSVLQAQAMKFSAYKFREALQNVIEKVVQSRYSRES